MRNKKKYIMHIAEMEMYGKKHERIATAIDKVEDKLLSFAANPENAPNNWNSYHDLKDRLIERLKDNWSEYNEWHFNTFNFNAY